MRLLILSVIIVSVGILSSCKKGISNGPIEFEELPTTDTLTALASYYYPFTPGPPSPVDSSDQIVFDMNGDGEDDFRFSIGHDYSWGVAYFYLTFRPLHERCKVAAGKQKDQYDWDAQLMQEGEKINGKLNWIDSSVDLMSSGSFTSTGLLDDSDIPDGTHYLPFELDYNLRETYGWIKFTKHGLYVFDVSYAYNPKSSILAGQTK